MLFDQDFAENFTIMLSFEIQSAHWISKQVTIYVTIAQHLDKDCWKSTTSALEKDSEVTVEPTDGSEKFWGRVVASSAAGASVVVEVVDGKGVKTTWPRAELRHRRVVSVAHITVSDDKNHDTWFVQEAMKRQWKW